MGQQLLHTPEGVRDIYGTECQKKAELQRRLHLVLKEYGYQDIETPAFEYFDVFRKEIGSIGSKELYKFFDRDGNTLALRPDFTPSIARAAATLFEADELPLRLCYMGNTFINHISYQGRLKENTQLGAECMGLSGAIADAEMIALAIACLMKAGLFDFQITIGNVDYFQSLIVHAGLSEEEETYMRELISNRNYFGVEELLEQVNVSEKAKTALIGLQDMMGGKEVLELALKTAPDGKAQDALVRLEEIYDILKEYKVEDHITFDLSMSGTYGYYTGIIFRGYTFGTGDAIVKGGRYDHLTEKFGKAFPSIGLAIIVDELMSALSRQKIEIELPYDQTLILYDQEQMKAAVSLAQEFRGKDKKVFLLPREAEKTLEHYLHYGRHKTAGSLLYLKDSGEITMYNLLTGDEKVVSAQL